MSSGSPTAPPQNMSSAQKWALYADSIVDESNSKLDDGNKQDAIIGYLKAADIYIMLAKHEENYSTWQHYIGKASMCHQKVKQLIGQAAS